ncbi:54S ribosomal protein L37 [Colletotrichum sidae]|uniref:Large ribosomal subunit protein mL54 n=3 Tax=Colletotrichum orbiculare species complex TaxID=2707354 RepID=N4VMU6_COLOR|nr:54S ribosomal protein L37 [Colletotrichum orbiculare MAFF 240422]TDZ73099.1 54S ribosomal protein L37 [Colletotrichum trifolii]TEA12585.1 54S ribosomal protein L37 [Colletotrichum sidae]
MICRTCLRRASALPRLPTSSAFALVRPFSASAPSRNAAAAAAPAGTSAAPDAAPAPPAKPITPPNLSNIKDETLAAAPERPVSSCPAGTILNGLNYFKGKTDPVALTDEEYPDWLWTVLETKKEVTESADDLAAEMFSKSKKQRKAAAKKQKALEAKLLASGDVEALAPKVPLSQQSINLPGEKGGDVEHNLDAQAKREALRKAMRKERKAKIKETNYLKSM